MSIEDNEIKQLFSNIDRVTTDINPLLSAGVLMASALRIYKSVLSPEEFERMTKSILDSTDEIKTIETVPTSMH